MLAHQGGWDELIFVAIPIALFVVVLFVASRRASARADADDIGADTTELPD
jgi:hypothetical protein